MKKRFCFILAFTIFLSYINCNIYANATTNIVVSNIVVNSEFIDTGVKSYPVFDNLQNGNQIYLNDTASAFDDVGIFAGMKYIQTLESHGSEHTNPFLSFDIDKNATIYIALRVGFNPNTENWVSRGGWTLTNNYIYAHTADSSSISLRVWMRDFPSGKVVLGSNWAVGTLSSPGNMYSVIIAPSTSTSTLTPQPTPQPVGYSSIPAFPGADGGGKYASGGRWGEVYKVTTLEDYIPATEPIITGSLRDAVSKGNRIIVFDVSGNIQLKSTLVISNSNITIAGQTAPGDGICVKDYSININADNIIMRFIRARIGDSSLKESDAIGGWNRSLGILDHISASWSSDETCSFYRMTDYTIQWSMITEPNFHTFHASGCHGFGGITGGNNFTYHHNVLAHIASRNPRMTTVILGEYANNVVYNWGYKVAYGDWRNMNYINNYYKPGLSTGNSYASTIIEVSGAGNTFYMNGNYINDSLVTDSAKKTLISKINANNWDGSIYFRDGATQANSQLKSRVPMKNAVEQSTSIQLDTAQDAYTKALNYAGASAPNRDSIDTRIVNDIKNGTGRFKYTIYPIDPVTGQPNSTTLADGSVVNHTQSEADRIAQFNGEHTTYVWPTLTSLPAPKDNDNDGMPDAWELERCLNPYDPTDANADYTGDGYTNIEKYLNDLTINSFPEGVVTKSPIVTTKVQADVEALTITGDLDNILTSNDLALPSTGAVHGSTITWTSSDSAIEIDSNTVRNVNRPENSDEFVTITASVTDGYTTMKKHFFSIVKRTKIVEDIRKNVLDAKDMLVMPSEIVKGTKLPLKGPNETTISWLSSLPNSVSIGSDGTIEILSSAEDVSINLTATISKGNTNSIYASESKGFPILVKYPYAQPQGLDDISNLSVNGDLNYVCKLGDIILPTIGAKFASSIQWTSDKSAITINNNTITAINRAVNNDEFVKLTATVKNGFATYKRDFYAIVKRINLNNSYYEAFENGVGNWGTVNNPIITPLTANDPPLGSNATGSILLQNQADSTQRWFKVGDVPTPPTQYKIVEAGIKIFPKSFGKSAGFFWYVRNPKDGNVTKILIQENTTGSLAFKIFTGSTWTYLRTSSGEIAVIPTNGNKWYLLKSVINFSGDYVANYNPKHDISLYECGTSNLPTKQIGILTGVALQSITADPGENTGWTASRIAISLESTATGMELALDDAYISTLDYDIVGAKQALNFNNTFVKGSQLPISGPNDTKIEWSSSNSELVDITSDGFVSTPALSDSTVNLTATIYKGDLSSINVKDTKTFSALVRQTYLPLLNIMPITFNDELNKDITNVGFSQGLVKCSTSIANNDTAPKTVRLILANYLNDKLIGLNYYQTNIDGDGASKSLSTWLTVNMPTNQNTLKAFIWDETNGITPLSIQKQLNMNSK